MNRSTAGEQESGPEPRTFLKEAQVQLVQVLRDYLPVVAPKTTKKNFRGSRVEAGGPV